MPFVQNKLKKLITYFFKQCAKQPKEVYESQDEEGIMKRKIYEGISKLSKSKRTKKNLQILLFGEKQQVMKLFDNLKVKYTNGIQQYLKDAQQKITNEICEKYDEISPQLWKHYRQSHDQQDCKKMEIYVNYVIVEKKLKWEETGNRRMNMRRIQQLSLQSTQHETQNDTQNEPINTNQIMISEQQAQEPEFRQQTEIQSLAFESNWLQTPPQNWDSLAMLNRQDSDWHSRNDSLFGSELL